MTNVEKSLQLSKLTDLAELANTEINLIQSKSYVLNFDINDFISEYYNISVEVIENEIGNEKIYESMKHKDESIIEALLNSAGVNYAFRGVWAMIPENENGLIYCANSQKEAKTISNMFNQWGLDSVCNDCEVLIADIDGEQEIDIMFIYIKPQNDVIKEELLQLPNAYIDEEYVSIPVYLDFTYGNTMEIDDTVVADILGIVDIEHPEKYKFRKYTTNANYNSLVRCFFKTFGKTREEVF